MNTENFLTNDGQLCGVIIAAGRGNRMSGINRWLPKTLLPINGRPVLTYQIDLLKSIGIHRIYIIVGYLKEKVRDYLDTVDWLGADIILVEQKEQHGIGHALKILEPKIVDSFILFLGDIFIIPDDFAQLVAPIKKRDCSCVLAVDYEKDPAILQKNFSVKVDEAGWVQKVVEKPRAEGPGLKGCGIYAFKTDIFPALDKTPVNANGELGITESIQTLIDLGYKVRTAMVSRWDINLTTPQDLDRCDKYLLSLRKSMSKTA